LLLPRCALIKKLQAALEEVAVLKSKRPGERGRRGIYDLARNGRSMIYGFHGFGLLRGATGSGPGCSGSQWIPLETKAAPRIGRNGPSIIGSCPYLGVILFATGLGGWWVSASKSWLSHGYPFQFGVAGSRKQDSIGSNGFMAALCLIKQSMPLGLYFYFYRGSGIGQRVLSASHNGRWRRFYIVIYVITSMRRRCAKS